MDDNFGLLYFNYLMGISLSSMFTYVTEIVNTHDSFSWLMAAKTDIFDMTLFLGLRIYSLLT